MLKHTLSFLALILSSFSFAQDPIFQPEGLVQLGEHTWAIPDNSVGGVPNAGIVVGHNATRVARVSGASLYRPGCRGAAARSGHAGLVGT